MVNRSRIDDVSQDNHMRKLPTHARIRSLIGVRLQIENERIGVLYVHGEHLTQFTGHDVHLLQMLADQASVALGWARLLLKPSEEIEQATADLFRLEDILENACNAIMFHSFQEASPFNLVAVQLIRHEEGIIETVRGKGIAEEWAGRARHYLEPDPALRDIQADIALAHPHRIEIIAGSDPRFDRWVYEEYHHERLVRVFMPILLARDESGKVVNNWMEYCGYTVLPDRGEGQEIHTVLELEPPPPTRQGSQLTFEVIGTVEVGYERTATDQTKKEIGEEQAWDLAKLVAEQAIEIHQTLLPHVLEEIVNQARKIVRADSATIHFFYDGTQNQYVYEACSGAIGRRFLEVHRPRENGLGQMAVRNKSPMFIPDCVQR